MKLDQPPAEVAGNISWPAEFLAYGHPAVKAVIPGSRGAAAPSFLELPVIAEDSELESPR